jgi:hypothetical protein
MIKVKKKKVTRPKETIYVSSSHYVSRFAMGKYVKSPQISSLQWPKSSFQMNIFMLHYLNYAKSFRKSYLSFIN